MIMTNVVFLAQKANAVVTLIVIVSSFAIFTLGSKLLEMFSEMASSHVTYFWFITCSVSMSVVLLLKYVFVVVLFHGIKLAQHNLFRMIMRQQRTT